MSKEDIDAAVKAAEQYAAEDKKRREEVEAKNTAENMCYQAEKLIKDNGDKLDEADKSNVNAKIAALKDAMNKGTDAMKTAQTELEQAVYSVSEKLYKNAAPQGDPNAAAGGQPGGQPSGDNGNNGNVYDADFKDVD